MFFEKQIGVVISVMTVVEFAGKVAKQVLKILIVRFLFEIK